MPVLVTSIGFWRKVSLGQIGFNGGDQLAYMRETVVSNGILSQIAEEAFDEVEPRAARGSEVHMKTRVCGQPSPNALVSVRAVVVGDQVWWCRQKASPYLRPLRRKTAPSPLRRND